MEPVGILAALGVASVVVLKAVDIVRKLVPSIDGVWVNVASVLVGVGVTFSSGLAGTRELAGELGLELAFVVPRSVDLTLTGVVLGLGAGYFADLRGRSVKAAEAMPAPVIEIVDDVKTIEALDNATAKINDATRVVAEATAALSTTPATPFIDPGPTPVHVPEV